MRAEEILYNSSQKYGSSAAVIDGHGVVSYAQLLDRSETIARAISRADIPLGSVIGISIAEASDFLAGLFGILQARCVAIPIAPHLPDIERQRVLTDTQVSWMLFSEKSAPFAAHERELLVDDLSSLRLGRIRPSTSILAPCFSDAAVIRHTSGTTGRSKGVVLSHDGVRERTRACVTLLDAQRDDVVLAPLPLSYHFIASALSFLRAGAAIIDCASLTPSEMIAIGGRYNASMMYASPLQYELLSRAAAGRPLKSLRRAFSTSALLTPTTASLFASSFGIRLTQVYGIIEVGLPLWNTNPTDPPSLLGRCPLPYESKVVDECGTVVPRGEIGELVVRGPGLFSGYLNGENSGYLQARDAWFATGDLVAEDHQGAFSYKGRKKTVINCGGNKIFPEEVEFILRQACGVSEAKVFAEPHPLLGSLVVAEVVTTSGFAADISLWRDHCYRQLSGFKVPKEFRVVSSLPTTGSGKVRRHTLAAQEERA
jgi:acyl-CoA synthetase (AMP-forming)/AMP-acid ligase II